MPVLTSLDEFILTVRSMLSFPVVQVQKRVIRGQCDFSQGRKEVRSRAGIGYKFSAASTNHSCLVTVVFKKNLYAHYH